MPSVFPNGADNLPTSLSDGPGQIIFAATENAQAEAINAIQAYLLELLDVGDPLTLTIAAGASESGAAVDLGYRRQFVLFTPTSGWDAAAPLTFLVAPILGGTYQPVYDAYGREVSIPGAAMVASRAISLVTLSDRLGGGRFLKIRSGNGNGAVTQTAQRVFTLVGK